MPNEPRIKDRTQREYYKTYGTPMLVEYAKMEAEKKVSRISELPPSAHSTCLCSVQVSAGMVLVYHIPSEPSSQIGVMVSCLPLVVPQFESHRGALFFFGGGGSMHLEHLCGYQCYRRRHYN